MKAAKAAAADATNYITAIDSNGIKVHAENNASTNYTKIDGNGMEVHKSVGGVDTTVASFGSSGATIGQTGAAHSIIDSDGQRFFASNGSTQLANIGYAPGASEGGTATAPYYSFGTRSGNIGNYSLTQGYGNTASGFSSHAEGGSTVASGTGSHAEGYAVNYDGTNYYTTASGLGAHAEGLGTTASGNESHSEGMVTNASSTCDHAEGQLTTASGGMAHAEGYSTTASSSASHAEGWECTASGSGAHAEGHGSTASGKDSHAQNSYTKASKRSQTALGTYNTEDTASTTTHPSGTAAYGKYALIIGNGTADNSRSNALTVDWSGNVDIASGAKYKINGTALAASDVGAEPTLTNISKSGSTYSGGIEDEKLLTSATITKWQTILS